MDIAITSYDRRIIINIFQAPLTTLKLFVTVLIEAFFNAVNWILVNRSISLYPLLVIIAIYLVAANTDGPHRYEQSRIRQLLTSFGPHMHIT
ncbi:hypothetical protein CYMTET_6106 [Cymbomonas tetramitiformis]|uniref:Uncharacterized protein n=1 Tax=Cymbomonas tetramitiformis TaxID=36881 RepID=A0AAE0GYB5_9CHLO|nr:hypothetical protein CYMTET_6106 [Cymbomonas tetramitiformis]